MSPSVGRARGREYAKTDEIWRAAGGKIQHVKTLKAWHGRRRDEPLRPQTVQKATIVGYKYYLVLFSSGSTFSFVRFILIRSATLCVHVSRRGLHGRAMYCGLVLLFWRCGGTCIGAQHEQAPKLIYYFSPFSATFFLEKLKIALPKFEKGTRRSDTLHEKFRHRYFHQRYFHYDAIRKVTMGLLCARQ